MKLFRTILSIFFCLLVVVSSSSFMVGIHSCRGNVQDVALFSKANTCASESEMPPCLKREARPCCEDQTVIHEGQDIKSDVSKKQLSTIPVIDFDHPLVPVAEIIPASDFAKVRYFDYDPPFRLADLTVEHQVFLI